MAWDEEDLKHKEGLGWRRLEVLVRASDGHNQKSASSMTDRRVTGTVFVVAGESETSLKDSQNCIFFSDSGASLKKTIKKKKKNARTM